MERLNDKKKALEELSIAQNLKPSFDEEFLIYRYKKIIEDNLNDIEIHLYYEITNSIIYATLLFFISKIEKIAKIL